MSADDGLRTAPPRDGEAVLSLLTRRDALGGAGRIGAVAALAASPIGLALTARTAAAQGGGLPQAVVEVLNFALTLERLEASYYEMGLAKSGLIPQDDREVFTAIRDHERAHVDALEKTLAGKAARAPRFDFTAGGAVAPFDDYATFLLVSQAFEDLGVRAYKGQAPKLVGMPDLLTTALTIHSVEARHAGQVRRLRQIQAWIPLTQPDAPAAIAPVYAGMAQTTKYDVDVVAVSQIAREPVTEAFDEPLDMAAVLEIAGMFIAG